MEEQEAKVSNEPNEGEESVESAVASETEVSEDISGESSELEGGEAELPKKTQKEKMPKVFWIVPIVGVVILILCIAFTWCFHEEKSEATCIEPKTCLECGDTFGDPLGHSAGEWENDGIDYLSATREKVQCCTVCDEILDSVSEPVDSFVSKGRFMFSPYDFNNILSDKLNEIDGCYLDCATGTTKGEWFAVGVTDGAYGDALGFFTFSPDGDAFLDSDSKYDEESFSHIILAFGTEGDDWGTDFAYASLAAVLACDPTLSQEDAATVCSDMMEGVEISGYGVSSVGKASKNGITYSVGIIDDMVLFTIVAK